MTMKKKLVSAKAPLPKFRSDNDAAEYFETHSMADVWDQLPEVKPAKLTRKIPHLDSACSRPD